MNSKEKAVFADFVGKSILKYHKKRILTFHPSKKLVQGRVESTGWADNKELRVATGGDVDVWLGVFVHETCHLDQGIARPEWMEKCEYGVNIVDEWLGGKNYHKKKVVDAINAVIELEWDCERRSIAKIKKHKLPVNLKEYAQMANAYIIGYHWTLENRKWCKKSYCDTRVWKKMPTKLVPESVALYPTKELIAMYND